jgi:hypothetical protein
MTIACRHKHIHVPMCVLAYTHITDDIAHNFKFTCEVRQLLRTGGCRSRVLTQTHTHTRSVVGGARNQMREVRVKGL